MKISKSQLKAIIKEEALKFKKAIELKKELSEIEKQLNEVKAGEVIDTDGVHAGQRKAEFSTKNNNPHLKMEDDIEGDMEDMEGDVPEEEIASDDTISKSEVVSAIEDLETKLGIQGHADESGDESGAEEGGDESDEEGAEDIEGEEEGEEFEFDTEEEIEEAAPVSEETVAEETVAEETVAEETVAENLDEPIEGNSVAQVAKDSTVDDDMTKDNHVKECEEMDTNNDTDFNSGEVKEETIAEAEKKRMSFLAGILKG